MRRHGTDLTNQAVMIMRKKINANSHIRANKIIRCNAISEVTPYVTHHLSLHQTCIHSHTLTSLFSNTCFVSRLWSNAR